MDVVEVVGKALGALALYLVPGFGGSGDAGLFRGGGAKTDRTLTQWTIMKYKGKRVRDNRPI